MQNTVRNLLIAGARIAIGVATSAPSAARVAALCDPGVNRLVLAIDRDDSAIQFDGDRLTSASPLINAVYAVTSPATCIGEPASRLDNSRDSRRPTRAWIHSNDVAPRLDQWALDARGVPLPWILKPFGHDGA